MGHHPPGESRPGAVRVVLRRHPPDCQGVDPRPDDREERGQQRQRRDRRKEDDDRPGDPDRAQDHELEEDQPEEPEEHGQAGEEDGPAGRRDGRLDRARDTVPVADGPGGELLSKATRHEQRVVDAQAEPKQRRQVQHEDAHRGETGDDGDRREGDDDGRAAHDQRHSGCDDRSEDDQQGDRRQRQRDHLAPSQVGLRDRLDVAVERGAAGQLDVEAGRMGQSRGNSGQRGRRVVGRDRHEDDVVGRPTVHRYLARRERVARRR